jgi:HSP20 family protein
MDVRDVIPRSRNRNFPSPMQTESGNPFLALHREMNRIFDDFARGFDMPAFSTGWSGGWPNVEVSETDDDVRVVAELPGLDAKDIEVTLNEGVLTLKGHKKAESRGTSYSERWHGHFQRAVQLGPDVDPEKLHAEFRNGILTITAAKRPEAKRQVKRIPITAG